MSPGVFSIFTMKGNNAEKIKQRQEEEEEEDLDAQFLGQMGYNQELYRGFSPFMSFAFCFTSINVLTTISIGFVSMLTAGGSCVIVWSWIIGSFFTILISLSLAEICSVYPCAGAVYHWSGKLVSPKHAPLASFICGWFNFIGNVAGDSGFSAGFATVLNAALVLNGNASLSIGSQVGIGIAITFIWAALNALPIDKQGWLNNVAAFLQISSTIIIVIVLLVMAPQRAVAKDVFTSTYNSTGFPLGYAYCLGILSTLLTFSGYEAGAHLAEETRGAARALPRSMVATCICSAVIGFIYLLALLFVIPNVTTFMHTVTSINASSDDNQPISPVTAALQFVLPTHVALALTILIIINIFFAGMASITMTSRIGFAMARDNVFPFSDYLKLVFKRTQVPLVNVIFICIIDSFLLLIQLVSTTGFSALVLIAAFGYQISYLMPIFFRCTTARHTFHQGGFSLGRLSIPIGIVSCIWLFITSIFMFSPIWYPVTKTNMNYTIVIISGFALIPAIYWIVSARHSYVGPNIPAINPVPSSLRKLTADNVTIVSEPESVDTMITRF